ncbi:MAG: hypothetical protein JNL21_24130 [Myxococcales bacterium]|nr:hypothetical protein [Myxococcales bacterium]
MKPSHRMVQLSSLACALLTGACKQEVLVGRAYDAEPESGGGGLGADGGGGNGGSAAGAGGSGGGFVAPDPVAICAAMALCEIPEPTCVHDTTCALAPFRPELQAALAECLATCGKLDDCWLYAIQGATPPPTFAAYVSHCNQSVVACENNPRGMGHDWCEYDFLSGEFYTQALACFELSCAGVNACLRAYAFQSDATCITF